MFKAIVEIAEEETELDPVSHWGKLLLFSGEQTTIHLPTETTSPRFMCGVMHAETGSVSFEMPMQEPGGFRAELTTRVRYLISHQGRWFITD